MIRPFLLLPCFVFFALTLTVLCEAQATRMIITEGHGQHSGFCSYTQGTFCIQNLQSTSDREGQRDAQWNCEVSRGRAITYTGYCNTSCYPNFLGPNDLNTLVRCDSRCRMQCEVEN